MRELESAIGRVVASRRSRLGMSQEPLAEAAGLHPTYISLVERGLRGLRCPSTRVLIALAHGLGAKPSNLLASIERELAKPERAKRSAARKRVPRKRSTRRS
jgi:transcriptional regulator with XRE-family HTH domain